MRTTPDGELCRGVINCSIDRTPTSRLLRGSDEILRAALPLHAALPFGMQHLGLLDQRTSDGDHCCYSWVESAGMRLKT